MAAYHFSAQHNVIIRFPRITFHLLFSDLPGSLYVSALCPLEVEAFDVPLIQIRLYIITQK